jgi:hypothetical protein
MQRTITSVSAILSTTLCLALASAPRAAHAQSADAPDVLVLADGTTLRGHVTEIHPGRDTTIVLLSGTTRTVPVADIASSSGPSFAPAPAPSQAPSTAILPVQSGADPLATDPAALANVYRAPGPGRAPVRVESPGGQQVIATDVSTANVAGFPLSVRRDVCLTPCTLYLPLGMHRIYAGGADMEHSTSVLDVPPSGLQLTLNARSFATLRAAVVLDVLGVLGMTASVPMLIFAAAENGNHADHDPVLWSGAIALGLGTAMLITGIALDAGSPRGAASVTPLPERASARAGGGGRLGVGVVPHEGGASGVVGGVF